MEGKVKAFFAILGGFALTLAIFVSGAVVATSFITAKPVQEAGLNMNQAQIWTVKPRAVDAAAQEFERLPARPVAPQPNIAGEAGWEVASNEAAEDASPSERVDNMITASVHPTASEDQPMRSVELPAAHVDWCANRYRSYRPRDNSYTPYSGGRRTCVSPYMDAAEELSPPPDSGDSYAEDTGDAPEVEYVSADTSESTYLNEDHVNYCFSRYRSYRPEDNTYQPYGGGPRRQCR